MDNAEVTNIDTNHVESITILKGAETSARYGAAGVHGVIMLTTKKGKFKKEKK